MSDSLGHTPPRLSEAAIADYRRLLNDKSFEEQHPERYAVLKASVDTALAETGQSLNPPSDSRSPAVAQHDRSFGVTVAGDRPVLPANLAWTLESSADPKAVAKHLERAGHDYAETVAAAQRVLLQMGSAAKAETLSAPALVQLSV